MLSFKNVLIPTDFSQAAWNAIKLGLQMINEKNGCITLFHVYPFYSKFKENVHASVASDVQAIERIKTQMTHLCDEMQIDQVKINPVVVGGEVDVEVLRLIKDKSFDLVIMGVNSSGFDNQPGTNLSKVIEQSLSPVLVVPCNFGERISA